MIWIIPLFLYLFLFTGTRNLMEYNCNQTLIPLKFPIGLYVIVFIAEFIPIINIGITIYLYVKLILKLLDGYDDYYGGYVVQEGKKNWVDICIRFFLKKV